jgi:polysaccharide pyruvyl transferase WcaK-like protein
MSVRRASRGGSAPRVGLFGNLGSGNIGNDASMEAILHYLSAEHPDAVIDALCGGPDEIRERYGIPAIPLFWYHRYYQRVSGISALCLKLAGKVIDVFRIASWVRKHDVVIVPGMGVLEASLPLRPWGFPYAMFLLSASGRVFRTKIALVSVGAGVINQRMTRWFFDAAARMAFYRSYRNTSSREAMRQRGQDVSNDRIYPDLAFALPAPNSVEPVDARLVCVGVMEYHGSNDDRRKSAQIRSEYVAGMKHFVGRLVDQGRSVRLLIGDTNGSDDVVVREIIAEVRQSRPDMEPGTLAAQQVTSLDDIMRAMVPASCVVAIRFHNVLAGLKMGKPTIAISYSPKHDELMKDMGVPEFCLAVNPFDVDALVQAFAELESHTAELGGTLADHNHANEQLLKEQFAILSAELFPGATRRS